jgi:hypothetical protein
MRAPCRVQRLWNFRGVGAVRENTYFAIVGTVIARDGEATELSQLLRGSSRIQAVALKRGGNATGRAERRR